MHGPAPLSRRRSPVFGSGPRLTQGWGLAAFALAVVLGLGPSASVWAAAPASPPQANDFSNPFWHYPFEVNDSPASQPEAEADGLGNPFSEPGDAGPASAMPAPSTPPL